MSNTMMYKDYAARVEYSEDDGCFVGHIAGIRDVVGFHGESVSELHARAAMLAQARGKSLNAMVAEAIEQSLADA